MLDWVFHAANLIIAACYYAIFALILAGLVRERQLGRNILATTTAGIFLTCAMGHSVHALGTHIATADATASALGMPQFVRGYFDSAWPQAIVDALTVIPAIIFLALRRRYGLVIQGPHAILRFERQLAAKDEEMQTMREVDHLKDEFVAMVSHELRTPLTGIIGYSEIMLREMHGPLTPRQQQHQQAIRDSAQRLLGLINDLLDVAKLEAAALTIAPLSLDLSPAVDQAVATVHSLVSAKRLNVERRVPGDLPPVLADPDRLQQMLVNLLSNAIKFTPDGGTITIGALNGGAGNGRATSDGEESITIYIRDSGLGIPPDQIERIWDRFYQVDSSSTRRYGGTGLGLAIVKNLAALHGGRAWAESAGTGEGATFYFTLARAPAAAPAVADLPLPAGDEGGRDVLIAEEDADAREVLRSFLENEGYRVTVAPDGPAVLSLASRLQPFAIALGVHLPGLDGWGVLRGLKRNPATRDLPVLMLSALEHRQYALEMGVLEYLTKPLSPDALAASLRHLLIDARARGGDVLLVEDDADLRTITSTLLESEGFRVRVATRGEEALAAIAEQPPGLVVLDLMLPGIDGFAILRRLRENSATRGVPVVVLTAKELSPAERTLLERDTQQVISKPGIAQELLLAQVSQALRDWSEQRLPTPRRTVLVVDDERDVRDIVRTVVEEYLGQRAVLAADGEEALALAQTERPDLVLLDLMLPRLSGFDVVRRLRQDPSTAGLRVFALTALARPEDRADALLAGCDSYLDKPFSTDALADRLRVALGIVSPSGAALR